MVVFPLTTSKACHINKAHVRGIETVYTKIPVLCGVLPPNPANPTQAPNNQAALSPKPSAAAASPTTFPNRRELVVIVGWRGFLVLEQHGLPQCPRDLGGQGDLSQGAYG